MMTIRNYVRAKSLEEAYELNQKRSSRIIGGMVWMKMMNTNVGTAIDLCDLGLNQIEETEDSFSIGAMVSLRDLELHEGFNAYTNGAARKAVEDIVGVQFRNCATVGGSIFGRFGFSDVLTFFLTTDCWVELYKGGLVPLAEFNQMKKDRDILVRLIVKKTPGTFVYTAMRNSRTDFPILTCAVSETAGTYRVAIGARPARAMVLSDEQGLLSGGITKERAEAFANWAAEHTPTGSNLRGSAAYRTHLVQVLCRRALMELGGKN